MANSGICKVNGTTLLLTFHFWGKLHMKKSESPKSEMLEGFGFFHLANSGICKVNWGRWFGRPFQKGVPQGCLTPAWRAPKTSSLGKFRNSACLAGVSCLRGTAAPWHVNARHTTSRLACSPRGASPKAAPLAATMSHTQWQTLRHASGCAEV